MEALGAVPSASCHSLAWPGCLHWPQMPLTARQVGRPKVLRPQCRKPTALRWNLMWQVHWAPSNRLWWHFDGAQRAMQSSICPLLHPVTRRSTSRVAGASRESISSREISGGWASFHGTRRLHKVEVRAWWWESEKPVTVDREPTPPGQEQGRDSNIPKADFLDVSSDPSLETDPELERQVFEFMQQSGNPEVFPTKSDLLKAGRRDLVDAILEEGGWLAIGWDSDEGQGETGSQERSMCSSGFETGVQTESEPALIEPVVQKNSRSMFGDLMKAAQSELASIGLHSLDKRMEEAMASLQRLKSGLAQETASTSSSRGSSEDLGKAGHSAGLQSKQEKRPKGYWNKDENVQAELEEYIREKGARADVLPTAKELIKDGRADLANAIGRRGGWAEAAAKFGLKSPGRHQVPDIRASRSVRQKPQEDDVDERSEVDVESDSFLLDALESSAAAELVDFTSAPGSSLTVQRVEPDVSLEQHLPRRRKRRKKRRRKEPGETAAQESSSGEGTSGVKLQSEVGIADVGSKLESKQAALASGGQASTSFGLSPPTVSEDKPSLADRIDELEASLKATRDRLLANREEMRARGRELREMREKAMEELTKATNSLEFRENQILRTKRELRTTQAEVKALEGRVASQLRESRSALSEREQQLVEAKSALKHLRATQVVWPHEGEHVELVGSFDGWNQHVKMERSNAGVFVTTLQLYPGQYQIKFVVDGNWRVDHLRPITYSGGNENNVLYVF